MHLRKMFRNILLKYNWLRSYSSSRHPFEKTWSIISSDIPNLNNEKKSIVYPEHCDIVIIGGGFLGSAIAYWLKVKAGDGLSVVVLEKDLSFKNAQRNLINGGQINQHFSLLENAHLSQFSAEFLRNIKDHLGKQIDVQFKPNPNLLLACNQYAERLECNVELQREIGVKNKFLMPEDIKLMYPWINVDDIKLGCIGVESEGHFNSWALLKGLVEKSQEMGTSYIEAEVTGFELETQRDVLMEGVAAGKYKRLYKVEYKTPNGEEYGIKFAMCILAAGYDSKDIATLAEIGVGDGMLSVPLPIESRKQHVYSIKDIGHTTGLDTPHIIDTSGVWCRRNDFGNDLLCGQFPLLRDDGQDLDANEYFNSHIKPRLANRIPMVASADVNHIATEVYDFNTYDESGILGPHPYYSNMYIAAGFGKYGCSHAPAIGRALTELLINGIFVNVDLTRFGFDRLLMSEPMMEFNIY